MIKKELDFVFITTDGSKFLYKKEANLWQDHLNTTDKEILKNYESPEYNNKQEETRKWRQTKAKQRAIDLKEKLFKK